MWITSRRTSGSSVREKESSGSRKELGRAVSMLVVWKPAVTWVTWEGRGEEGEERERCASGGR